MKVYLISDNIDTLVGMRLVGIRGRVTHEEEEVKAALEDVQKDSEIGILLVTKLLMERFGDLLSPLQLREGFPILLEIPDRHGMGNRKDIILQTIKESMGVKI